MVEITEILDYPLHMFAVLGPTDIRKVKLRGRILLGHLKG
jgi:hypothetical protein